MRWYVTLLLLMLFPLWLVPWLMFAFAWCGLMFAFGRDPEMRETLMDNNPIAVVRKARNLVLRGVLGVFQAAKRVVDYDTSATKRPPKGEDPWSAPDHKGPWDF